MTDTARKDNVIVVDFRPTCPECLGDGTVVGHILGCHFLIPCAACLGTGRGKGTTVRKMRDKKGSEKSR